METFGSATLTVMEPELRDGQRPVLVGAFNCNSEIKYNLGSF